MDTRISLPASRTAGVVRRNGPEPHTCWSAAGPRALAPQRRRCDVCAPTCDAHAQTMHVRAGGRKQTLGCGFIHVITNRGCMLLVRF